MKVLEREQAAVAAPARKRRKNALPRSGPGEDVHPSSKVPYG